MHGFEHNLDIAIDADLRDMGRPRLVESFHSMQRTMNEHIRHDVSFFSSVPLFISEVEKCLASIEAFNAHSSPSFAHTSALNDSLSHVVRLLHSLEQSPFLKAHFPETYRTLDDLWHSMSRAKEYPMTDLNAGHQPLQGTFEREAAQVEAFMAAERSKRAVAQNIAAATGATGVKPSTKQLSVLRFI